MHKYLRLFLILIVISFNSPILFSEIRNVPSEFQTIQAGIDASVDGDTVLVAPGIYHERIILSAKSISLFSHYILSYDASNILNTVIDGDNSGSVITLLNANSAVNGFTIINGNAENGGGIAANNGSAVLKNLIIRNNAAQNLGGGVYLDLCNVSVDSLTVTKNTSGAAGGGIYFFFCTDAEIENSTISYNHSNDGGGIYSTGSLPQFRKTTLFGNSAIESGGGFCSSSDVNPGTILITECLVDSNNAGISGGGLYFNNCNVSLDSLTVKNNKSDEYGGGIFLLTSIATNISNSLITDNQSNEGGGIFNARSVPQITNTNFYRNSVTGSGGAFSSHNQEEISGTIQMSGCIIDSNSAGISGGGLYFNRSNISLDSFAISHNMSGEYGGGICFFACSTVVITNAQFTGNHSHEGGGIFNTRSIPQIRNSKFYGNSSEGSGGAFSSQNGSGNYGAIIISDCVVDSNTAGLAGGGLVFNQSPFNLSNTLLSKNNASNGGALYFYLCESAVLINNSIFDNNAFHGGAIVDSNAQNSTVIFNSILWGNTPDEIFPENSAASIFFTDIAGGWEGIGNISVEPKENAVTYTLLEESPCIGTGTDSVFFNNSWYFNPATDLLGNPRPSPLGTKPDMGAFEETTVVPVISTFQLSINVYDKWNIVSIPGLLPENQNVTSWWSGQDSLSNVFLFQGIYQSTTIAEPGKGYWMKHLGPNVYNTGDEWPASGIQFISRYPLTVVEGWNLIGGYEDTVQTSLLTTSPGGLIQGSVFAYQDGYQISDNLFPGYGYWIKLSGPGQLNIPSGGASGPIKNVTAPSTEKFGKILITDNAMKSSTLYAVNGDVEVTSYDLPPIPPQGAFDIRYSTQRYAERLSNPNTIEMSGVQYPVRIKAVGTAIILSDETGKDIAALKSGEEVTLSASANKLTVRESFIPSVYALEQNYPNPFNPGTTIKFSIPEDVHNVKLVIYSALGEKVAELVNTSLPAGIYNYNWNASNVASGLYIYQLITEKFVSMKKMVLIK